MQVYIDAYRQELLEVNNFAPNTVKLYLSCLDRYFEFAREHLKIDPLHTNSKHLQKWLAHLKGQGRGRSNLIHDEGILNLNFQSKQQKE